MTQIKTQASYHEFQKWVQERILKKDSEGNKLFGEIIERLTDTPAAAQPMELLRQIYVREAARAWSACLNTPEQTESGRALARAYQDAANKIEEILREHNGRRISK
jgi:hypothetical protein